MNEHFKVIQCVLCNCKITESQKGWGWQGPLEVIWSKPLLKQGQNCVALHWAWTVSGKK